VTTHVRLLEVSKRYRVYRRRYASLKEMFVHRSRGEWEDRWALRGVTLGVEEGRSLGLIGANGSGKSTALKLMARILVPDGGRVEAVGRLASLIELGAGFQPEYTGRENLYLNASLLGLSKREVDRRFTDIVDFADLQDHIDDPLRTYSSGMYMRLGFSVAIHVDPEILLIDEILAVGDESFQHRCIDWLGSFKARGGTIVLVSHDLGSIRKLCQQAAWIEDGRVRALGPSAAVVDDYLDEVRGREEQLRALAEQRERSRTGPKAAELGAARILDERGRQTDHFQSGEGLVLEIPYRVHRRVETPCFGVALHANDGLMVHRTTTALQGIHIPPLEADGVVRVRFPTLALSGGGYRFTTSIHGSLRDDDPGIDVHDMRYKFWVDGPSTEGLVGLPHGWEVERLPAAAAPEAAAWRRPG
jgi:ABC-type polysaccharide/polyol phosphate transport system ATPase subunit